MKLAMVLKISPVLPLVALLALAGCVGGGGGTAMNTGGPESPGTGGQPGTPEPARPSPHQITTVGGNELKVGDASSNWYVQNGGLVRHPRTPGIAWVAATEYPIMDWLPSRYAPGMPQIIQGQQWEEASSFFWGHWSDNEERMFLGGYQYEPGTTKRIARFGLTLENDEITPWATGVKPLTDFVDTAPTQLQSIAAFYGTFVGLTHDDKQPVGAGVNLAFDLSGTDITGTFELTGLSSIERDGSLETFLGGELQHNIAVTGNTFRTTGGDPGTVTGTFAGEGHEAAVGTFQHSAFIGVFDAEYDAHEHGSGSGASVTPQFSGDWWLPDNAQAIVQAQNPTVTTIQIPQKLVNAGFTPLGRSSLTFSGYARQHDGAYVRAFAPLEYPTAVWKNRAVADVNGVSFGERTRSTGTAQIGQHEKQIVGLLDYSSFGMWLIEEPGGDRLGLTCCEWSVFSQVGQTVHRTDNYFPRGTYVWNGGMVGAEKRDPTQTILGDTRIEMQVNAVAYRGPSNTINVSFTDIRKVNDGNAVSDMSWRLNRIGFSGVGGFWVDEVGTGVHGDNLVSGSGSIALTWSGPNHDNVVGVYDTARYVGSFGGTKP
ncbi:MAG: hypothetical protein F4Y02_14285 [Chloroflexi bacterium]|nr:hypothetical protein [Chloroflexota bacterium]